jgi:hypothetical protein
LSIKSDKWIRRMALSTGMIEPFEPDQVRTGGEGQKIVSYGTSSYGYDIRCAREFKVFTNIFSTVVDPKNFDERSFVDIEADVCTICRDHQEQTAFLSPLGWHQRSLLDSLRSVLLEAMRCGVQRVAVFGDYTNRVVGEAIGELGVDLESRGDERSIDFGLGGIEHIRGHSTSAIFANRRSNRANSLGFRAEAVSAGNTACATR